MSLNFFKRNRRKSKDYTNRCGNCHALLGEGFLYCEKCGTKRGEGSFKPYENVVCYYYGPPIKIIYHCSNCNYKWLKVGVGIENSNFCPKCKSPSIEKLEESAKTFGERLGDYLEENEPDQLLSESEVNKVLNLRETYRAIQAKKKKDYSNYEQIEKETVNLITKNGFKEYKKERLSNREAERINLVDKILNIVGKKNVFSKGNSCPKCSGSLACQLRNFEINDNGEEIIPQEIKEFTFSSRFIWSNCENALMCMQCGEIIDAM